MEHTPTGPRRILSGAFLAPILVGAAYAFMRAFPGNGLLDAFYLQSPLTLSFFSGLIMAFACRPVLLRIPWSLSVALCLALSILLGLGPVAGWCLARLIELLGLASFPYIFPRSILPDALGALGAAMVMAGLFSGRGGGLDLASLRARLTRHRPMAWAGRLAVLGALAVAIWLAAGWIEALWAGTHPRNFTPVIVPNLWIQLTSGGFEAGAPPAGGAGDAGAMAVLAKGAALLALYWLRALALFLPLLPVALALRGRWLQITVVFVLLLFIVGDFAPLIMDQPFPSTRWLLLRMASGILQAVLLGGAAARLLGQIRGVHF